MMAKASKKAPKKKSPTSEAPASPPDAAARDVRPRGRLNLQYLNFNQITPYSKNPRKNQEAVPYVKKSLQDFGWRVPLVVDANNVVVAGHTRLLAAKELHQEFPDGGWDEVPCFVATDLTPAQVQAFRLIDNKVGEIASWDFDSLSSEIAALESTGINMQDFGWTREELDCLQNVVAMDCLATVEVPTGRSSSGLGGKKMYESHDGSGVRISFGSLSFLVRQEDFDVWNNEIHQANQYNPEAVIEDIADRLGLLEQKRRWEVMKGEASQNGQQE